MALTLSNWYVDNILNETYRNIAWTRPTTIYLALYTSNPTSNDTGTEVSGGSYVRKTVTFAAPVGQSYLLYDIKTGVAETITRRTVKSSAEIVFDIATADWGLVTHIGLRTAATGGNLIAFGPANNSRSILSGERMRVLPDNLTVSLG